MVIGEKMENQNYLVIQENIVVNVVLWNGDLNQWQPPSDALLLPQDTTPSLNWEWVNELEDYGLVQGFHCGIGDTWDGSTCRTTQPKPAKSEPITPPYGGGIPTTVFE